MTFIWQRDDPHDTPMAPADYIAREYPDQRPMKERFPTLVEKVCSVVDAAISHRGLIAVQSH